MNYFGFMDETGILSNDPKQPYFALGLLILYDTSELMQKIIAIKARHNGIINAKRLEDLEKAFQKRKISKDELEQKKKEKLESKELKFNSLSQNKYLQMYKDIVELCLNTDYFYFSAFLIERNKIERQGKTTWNMQLSFARRHIQENCEEDDSITIIADYLNKPRNEPYFENKIRKLKQVFNACMLESDSSVFVQIVDIFIGAIVYRYKHPYQNKKTDKAPKMQLVQFIEQILEKKRENYSKSKTLKGNFTISKLTISKRRPRRRPRRTFYFSVFEKIK